MKHYTQVIISIFTLKTDIDQQETRIFLLKKVLILGVLILTFSAKAQNDSISNYVNSEGFGGPKTIGAQLQEDISSFNPNYFRRKHR